MDLVEGQHRCLKKAYAGTVLGVVMGGFASVANAFQAHGTKLPSVLANDPIARQTTSKRTIATMGALGIWSGVYQTTRCVLDDRGVTEPENTLLSTGVSVSPFLAVRALKGELPWVLILLAMDVYHRQNRPS